MRSSLLWVLALTFLTSLTVRAQISVKQAPPSELLQVEGPFNPHAAPPPFTASEEELEAAGDSFRAEKIYLDAIDYYRAALAKKPNDASLCNKTGITELLLQRYKDASKDFARAIKIDPSYADAYNNLGVIYYLEKKQGKAIKQYDKAIALRPDSASYYSNLGAAHFSKKEFEAASFAYGKAVQLDPDIFERSSHTGVAAQLSSPEDRARFDYVLAKLYAQSGSTDRSLQYLRKCLEEGYKGIDDVYKDQEFSALRKDPRFAELMAARPLAIPE
jgi:tetratricopeptide (TPR) repeat protein